ncbi:unnamed protein product [Ectocarpus sp. CCAP 1310/34]|nr:unnamed protein product [Ectocarpus sp. CCAP 1310/34]
MSSTFRTPAGGVVIQWDSYKEFWECLPNIPDAAKSLVTDALPTLTELVDFAKDKNFAATLKEAGVGTIPATRIANFTEKTIYDAKSFFFLSFLKHGVPACVFGGSVVLLELRGLVIAFRDGDRKSAVLGGEYGDRAVSRTQHEVALA